MSNDLNSISSEFRDFLLNRNLILADSITNNSLSSLGVGLGTQSSLQTLPNAVRASDDIEVSADTYRENVTLKNKYISSDDMIAATIINNNFSYAQSDGGYINDTVDLAIGGPSTQPYDVIGSIVKGTGFGLDSDGFYPQFDVRSSVAGRVLGQTGLINDTPLGGIAAERLLFSLAQRGTFAAQKELNEQFNLRPTSLIKGDPFLKAKWDVTVPSEGGFLGKVFDTALNLAGYEKPKSVIDSGGSIFQDENGFQSSTVDRNNALMNNTGKGQLTKVFELLGKNYYKPDYKVDDEKSKLGFTSSETYPIKSKQVVITNSVNSSEETDYDGSFDGSQNLWDSDIALLDDSKTLLSLTKSLFSNGDYVGIQLNNQFKETMESNVVSTQLNTPANGKLSKGSGVLDSTGSVFCRTFTHKKMYDNVGALQKNTGLIDYKNKIRNNIDDSVLGSNGFVKITPYSNPTGNPDSINIEKFMFSIENLAWDGEPLINLPKNEIGPGDTTSGTKGRIMWFPPYDIKFNDTTAVNWDDTKFIGRGEPIYTYNNTERSGNLSFKIIIDYPDYVNDSSIDLDSVRASIAAGCTDYNKYFSTSESSKIKEDNPTVKREIKAEKQPEPDKIVFYFANDVSKIDGSYSDYETTGDRDYYDYYSGRERYADDEVTLYPDATDYGLNKPWNEPGFIADLKEKLANDSSSVDIMIQGFASVDGTEANNDVLSSDRANTIKQWVLDNLGDSNDSSFTKRVKIDSAFFGESLAKTLTGTIQSLGKKIDRNATVVFVYNPMNDKQATDFTEATKDVTENRDFKQSIRSRFHNEAEYFKELEKTDKIAYDTIKEKVQFFQPAFHSITPEGFNSRLTFLQQCTRQGPTIQDTGAQNLAFGAPPVCILRIGDFYHTKIIINSLGIEYEPLVWDLNPEGVGVQPMIANISISFKFIGGSSLNGPINKLQNAVSFNFFGNAEIYDPRADTIVLTKGEGDDFDIVGKIKDGDKTLGIRKDETYSPTTEKPTEKMSNEMMNVAETELEKPLAATSLDNDKTILSSFDWSVTNVDGQIKVTYGNNDFSNLSKSYDVKLKVSSTSNVMISIMNTTITSGTTSSDSFQTPTSWTETFSVFEQDSSGDIPLNFKMVNNDLAVSTGKLYYFAYEACAGENVELGDYLDAAANENYKDNC